eukprot:scaffold37877_cov60-Phaeocystis_antarctica.AAC.3
MCCSDSCCSERCCAAQRRCRSEAGEKGVGLRCAVLLRQVLCCLEEVCCAARKAASRRGAGAGLVRGWCGAGRTGGLSQMRSIVVRNFLSRTRSKKSSWLGLGLGAAAGRAWSGLSAAAGQVATGPSGCGRPVDGPRSRSRASAGGLRTCRRNKRASTPACSCSPRTPRPLVT